MTPEAEPPDRLFYDGDCGLCHGAVTFLVRRDAAGRHFRFAPLGGQTFTDSIPAEVRATLPDSLVLQKADGRLFLRSAGVLKALERLGGPWRLLAWLGRVVPGPLRDFLYDRVAAIRAKLFAKPEGVCPLLPPELRRRFDP